jgi:hypothetical protein
MWMSYQFNGIGGEKVVPAEVIARRLRSPMDSLIRLTDAAGKVIAWNDDDRDKQEHLHRTYGVRSRIRPILASPPRCLPTAATT